MLKKDFSRGGFALTIAWISATVAQVVIDILCSTMFPKLYASPIYYWLVYIVSVYVVSFPLFVAVCGGKGTIAPVKDGVKITAKDFLKYILICLSLIYLFNFVGIIVNDGISRMIGKEVINPLETLDDTNQVLKFICTCLLAPFFEELMFRGVLLKKLRPHGNALAIWATAFAFGLYHGNFSQFFYATALGVVFASIVVKTNRLIYSMILHTIINTCGSVIIPGIMGYDNEQVQLVVVSAVLAIIVYGFILSRKMVNHITPEEKVNLAQVEGAVLNAGVITFIVLSGIMFALAIFL